MKRAGLYFLLVGLLLGSARGEVPAVSFEQRIGAELPLTAPFRDTEGKVGPLSTWFRGRPVVLWLGYAGCAQLCSVTSNGMVSALRQLGPSAGRDYDVVMISIDPEETPAVAQANRAEALGQYGRQPAAGGWHYLTGDRAAIAQVAQAVGFHFRYEERLRQYVHPTGFLLATPDGRVSAYFLGVDFAPARIAESLARARRNGLGQKVADFALACFRGDGIGGRYGRVIWAGLSCGVAGTVLALGFGVGRMLWQERRALRREQEGKE
jgi:protein SCO1/2